MHVTTLLVALAAVSPATAAIRGHVGVHRDTPPLGDEGNQQVGNCLINWEATKNSKGYESDTHWVPPKNADGSQPITKSGFACDDGDGQSAVEDSIRDLFGPVTSWPNDCQTGHTHYGGDSMNSKRYATMHDGYEVYSDCACTEQPVTLNAQCTVLTSACIMFATIDDVTNNVPSFKAYAFPTDDVACGDPQHQTEADEWCGFSCADSQNGNAHWYDATKAVTAAVTTLLSVARPDLAPACMNAALEAKAHPERFLAQTPEWHAIVDMLVEQHEAEGADH